MLIHLREIRRVRKDEGQSRCLCCQINRARTGLHEDVAAVCLTYRWDSLLAMREMLHARNAFLLGVDCSTPLRTVPKRRLGTDQRTGAGECSILIGVCDRSRTGYLNDLRRLAERFDAYFSRTSFQGKRRVIKAVCASASHVRLLEAIIILQDLLPHCANQVACSHSTKMLLENDELGCACIARTLCRAFSPCLPAAVTGSAYGANQLASGHAEVHSSYKASTPTTLI